MEFSEESIKEDRLAVKELNTYLASLDILEARDIDDTNKIKLKFQQKLMALQEGSIDEGFSELELCLREHLETQLADAYEVVISYRAKHYSQAEESKQPNQRVLTPKEVYFDRLTDLTDIDTVRGMASLYELGWGDFRLNHKLLCRYDNDTEKAVDVLSGNRPETLKNILKELYAESNC